MCTWQQCIHTEAICALGSSVYTRKQCMFYLTGCVHADIIMKRRQYMESVCVHGGRIFTQRQYMYTEAICVDEDKVFYRFTDTHLPDYTVSKVRSSQCELQ